jgi:hypothetical protein
MQLKSLAESQGGCPVKGLAYESTLGAATTIDRSNVATFMTQWYAFSANIPIILCVAAEKASCESERKNIVTNLHSELGLDTDGPSHPALLNDLIVKATGIVPTHNIVSRGTVVFLESLKKMLREGSPAQNAGIMLALEAVAYEIISILKEILAKSSNHALIQHPYITIHEEIEAEHINNTEQNISFHNDNMIEVNQGFIEMNMLWRSFWSNAFRTLVPNHD